MIFLLILAFAFIAWLEVPGMIQKKQKGELIAFWVIWAMAFTLSFLMAMGVKVPNPTKFIQELFMPLVPK